MADAKHQSGSNVAEKTQKQQRSVMAGLARLDGARENEAGGRWFDELEAQAGCEGELVCLLAAWP
jgi:hypothetical protein